MIRMMRVMRGMTARHGGGRLVVAAGVALAAFASSCGKDPVERRTVPLTAVARAGLQVPARFQPPANGLLTDAQIDRYVKVRRAAKGRSDEDAARAVGVDPEELAWIRTRVDEALLEADRRRIRTAADEVYGKTIATLRETRKSVRDEKEARSVDEQIAGLERERQAVRRADDVPASVAANSKKVAARRAEIEGRP
jgi:hypothetical protein